MGKISVLPEDIVNKIAAGEVIERPSSVLKELIENSVDANAKSISVVVRHGGRELIRVTDNGVGMSREDAEHSLQRHATSKIQSVEDIFRIESFGFRGEALPSIAAVSRLTLLSREPGASLGTEIKVAGGHIESIREAGTAVGTTVEVANLFFNTPARRKFLKTDRAESSAVAEVMTTFALGNPSLAFKFIKDKSMIVEYPSCVSLRERMTQIYDNEVVDASIAIQAEMPEIAVSGFVTAPEVSRINRTGQYLFINNRPIRSQALSFALRQGYDDTLPQNRHPLAFLFFDIDFSRVDVNVHPNKKEVRIANEREIQKLLMETIRIALHKGKKFPRVHLAKSSGNREEWSPTHVGRIDYASYPESDGSLALRVLQEAPAEHPYLEENQDLASLSAPVSEQSLELGEKDGLSIPRVLGQYHSTYIIADNNGELLIIDQHAAHERVMYEETLDILMSAALPSQRQLIPLTFSLDYREQEALEEYLPLLEKLGFGINSLGRNTYSVDAIPAFLDPADPKQFLLDFVHDAIEGNTPRALEDKKKALAATIACKRKAVKGSSHILPERMEHLVKSLFKTKQPLTCPHGRPTCITLSINDLERQFGRK